MLMLRKCPAGVYLMTLRKPNLQDPNASTLAAKGKVLLVLGWYLREGHVQANASLQISLYTIATLDRDLDFPCEPLRG